MLRYRSACRIAHVYSIGTTFAYFLAVAESGSTLGAGRALRVSQTTVARRIGALEEALKLPLFEAPPKPATR